MEMGNNLLSVISVIFYNTYSTYRTYNIYLTYLLYLIVSNALLWRNTLYGKEFGYSHKAIALLLQSGQDNLQRLGSSSIALEVVHQEDYAILGSLQVALDALLYAHILIPVRGT